MRAGLQWILSSSEECDYVFLFDVDLFCPANVDICCSTLNGFKVQISPFKSWSHVGCVDSFLIRNMECG